jgi:hypothetical protein
VAAGLLTGAANAASAPKQNKPDPHPYVGQWHYNGPQTCKPGHEGSDFAMEVQARRIFMYEARCVIQSMRKLSDTAYRFTLSCRGPDHNWQVETIFSSLEKSKVNDDLLVRLDPKDGSVTAYRRCP